MHKYRSQYGCARPNVFFTNAAAFAADGRLHRMAWPDAAMDFTAKKLSATKNFSNVADFAGRFLSAHAAGLVLLAKPGTADVEHLFFAGGCGRIADFDWHDLHF